MKVISRDFYGEAYKMENFQEELRKGIQLVDFNAPWCAPCRALEPFIKKIRKTYQNRVGIFEVNIDEQGPLAVDFGVQSIPTLIIFKDGKEIRRFVGLQSETTIKEGLDEILLPLNH
jgi:thioredoxin 1